MQVGILRLVTVVEGDYMTELTGLRRGHQKSAFHQIFDKDV